MTSDELQRELCRCDNAKMSSQPDQLSSDALVPARRRSLQLGLVVTGFYAVVWGLQLAIKDNWLRKPPQ